VRCTTCGTAIDPGATCPRCAVDAIGRLAGVLGVVCRSCDAYNDPSARSCARCGKPLGELGAALTPFAPEPPATATAAAPSVVDVAELLEAPASAAARLVVERGEATPGTAFRLDEDELAAGRSQAIAFPGDPCLAPLHATFSVRDGAVRVRDEGAAGGVYVRVRAGAVPLRTGALFAVGDRLLRYGGTLQPPPSAAADGTRRLGAPRPEKIAVVVEEWLEGGVGGRTWVRAGPSVTIGRGGCAIDLGDDRHVSQAHAELALDASGAAQLRDLGSADGTFIRLPPGSERELRDGDAVRLGREVLRVEAG
jgi:hypothetical protein